MPRRRKVLVLMRQQEGTLGPGAGPGPVGMEPQPEELEDWIDETQQKIFKVAPRWRDSIIFSLIIPLREQPLHNWIFCWLFSMLGLEIGLLKNGVVYNNIFLDARTHGKLIYKVG
jgi:hypothetical protein